MKKLALLAAALAALLLLTIPLGAAAHPPEVAIAFVSADSTTFTFRGAVNKRYGKTLTLQIQTTCRDASGAVQWRHFESWLELNEIPLGTTSYLTENYDVPSAGFSCTTFIDAFPDTATPDSNIVTWTAA